MTLSMYDVSVPVLAQGLKGVAGVLAKAEAHCEAHKIDPAALIGARLFPDMAPFMNQIAMVIDHSAGAVTRMQGADFDRLSGLTTFEALKSAVAAAQATVAAADRAAIDACQDQTVVFKVPSRGIAFTGKDYLLTFSLQNFFFHAATAYDILRHNGVELAKGDFLARS